MYMKQKSYYFNVGGLGIVCALLAAGLPLQSSASGSRKEVPAVTQQNGVVRGTVVDQNKEPLVGVTIAEKGTKNYAITDLDGKFSLKTETARPVLQLSYVGYKSQEVAVGNRSSLDISMTEDNQVLNEVIVQGFGFSQKKASLTGAISSINSDDISRSLSTTVTGNLVGKIAGINSRQPEGQPGQGTTIRIRNNNDAPLYVIDGIVKDETQFNNLDANDIEQISVLKDASAAIYGVRASNGVIVVTTKHGRRNQQLSLTIEGYYGIQSRSRNWHTGNAADYVRMQTQSATLLGQSPPYTREEYDKWQAGKEPGYEGFDWLDFEYDNSPQKYIKASATGGSERINYYFSMSNLSQESMIHNFGGFYRTNVQMSIDAQVTQRLTIGASMNGRMQKDRRPGIPGTDYWTAMNSQWHNLPIYYPYANNNPNYPARSAYSDFSANPAIWTYENAGVYKDKHRAIQLNAHADLDIGWGLKAQWLVGYYYDGREFNNHEYTWKLYSYDKTTGEYNVFYDMSNPWQERQTGYDEEWNSNLRLTWDRTFGQHHVNVVLGMDASQRRAPNTWVHQTPVSNKLESWIFENMDSYNDTPYNTQGRVGYIGRLNYDYAQKYLLEVSARRDGSWKWAPGHRWGTFPSVSAGWRISQENFWKDSFMGNIFDDLKLRVSYGVLGDDNVGGYSAYDFMDGYNYNQGGTTLEGTYTAGSQARGLPATTFTWIKTHVFDVGIDFAFLGNRLTGSFDYFSRKRTGLPARRYDVLIPSEVGFSLPQENLNSDLNRGFDGEIKWADKFGEVSYSAGFNFTFARRYNWDSYKPRFANSWDEYRNSSHHRLQGATWVYENDGQFKSWEEIANYPVDIDGQGNKTLYPGDLKYKDLNGDGIINWADQRPKVYRTGGSTPNFNYGINLALSWKGIDFSMDWSGSFGSGYNPGWQQLYPFWENGDQPDYVYKDSWHLSDPFDANSKLIPGKYPIVVAGRNNGASVYWANDYFYKNVRYIKLRNFEVGYTFPQWAWLKWAHVSSLRLYVAGSNVFTICNVAGLDPENSADNGIFYATPRVINFGFNIKF